MSGYVDYQYVYKTIDLLYNYNKNSSIIDCYRANVVCYPEDDHKFYHIHLFAECEDTESDIARIQQLANKFPDSSDAQKLKEVKSNFEIKHFMNFGLCLYASIGFFDNLDESIEAMSKIKQYCDEKYGENSIHVSVPEKSKKHCYVATAVYGSYDCPQVWRFRRYRDETLSKNIFGRLFIKLYYAVSPTIIKYFGKTKWFNSFFRRHLDKFYLKLAERGYDDTPYQDK